MSIIYDSLSGTMVTTLGPAIDTTEANTTSAPPGAPPGTPSLGVPIADPNEPTPTVADAPFSQEKANAIAADLEQFVSVKGSDMKPEFRAEMKQFISDLEEGNLTEQQVKDKMIYFSNTIGADSVGEDYASFRDAIVKTFPEQNLGSVLQNVASDLKAFKASAAANGFDFTPEFEDELNKFISILEFNLVNKSDMKAKMDKFKGMIGDDASREDHASFNSAYGHVANF